MKSEIIQDLVSDLKHVKFLGTSFVIEEKQWTKQQMLPAQQGHGLPPLSCIGKFLLPKEANFEERGLCFFKQRRRP